MQPSLVSLVERLNLVTLALRIFKLGVSFQLEPQLVHTLALVFNLVRFECSSSAFIRSVNGSPKNAPKNGDQLSCMANQAKVISILRVLKVVANWFRALASFKLAPFARTCQF